MATNSLKTAELTEFNYNSFGPRMGPDATPPDPNRVEKCISKPLRFPPLINKSIFDMNDEELFHSTWESCFRLAEFEDVKDQLPKLRAYYAQLYASEGFDLDENPTFGMPNGGIMKAPCCRETHPDLYEKYMDIAQFVIQDYNAKNGTAFVVSKVETVNRVANGTADIYYITCAAASRKEEEKIFQAQAMVFNYPIEKKGLRIIHLCRIKA